MAIDRVSINFKVDRQLKKLLEDLVVLKTIRENKSSSQHAVLEEALLNLLLKYKEENLVGMAVSDDSIQ